MVGERFSGDLDTRAVLFDQGLFPVRFERHALARREGQHRSPGAGRHLLDVGLPCESFGTAVERPPAAAGQQRQHCGCGRVFPGRGCQRVYSPFAGRFADVVPYALLVVAVDAAQQREILDRFIQQFQQLPVLRRTFEPFPEDCRFLFGGRSFETGFEYFFDLVFETHVVFMF